MKIDKVNKEIFANKQANDYPSLIDRYDYVFFHLERRLTFFATKDYQTIVDFSNKIFYICEDYKIVSLAYKLDEEDWKYIINNYNHYDNQRDAIVNIVNRIKNADE